jgi:Na+/H+ antiporter NhaC
MAAAMAGVIARSGGWAALGAARARRAGGARSAQLAAALLGGGLFLDAVTSALATGLAMRPLADRCRVAREKLAYIADATAAPVAALALAGTAGAPLAACFYSWFALVVLGATIVLGRELGSMRGAARRVSGGEGLLRAGALPLVQPLAAPAAADPAAADRAADRRDAAPWLASPWRAANALVPLAVLVLVVAVAGGHALLLGAIAAWVAAVLLALVPALLGLRAIVAASLRGVGGALPALAALALAGIVGTTARDLGAADVLLALLPIESAGALRAPLLFLIAAAIAFALGNPLGSLGIVLPLASMPGPAMPGAPATLLAAAALQGVAAGVHLSPLAPSALAASAASAVDHLDHVRTQLPYGLLAFAATLLLGFAPVALGVPPRLALAAGALTLVAVVRVAGRGDRAC